MPRADYKTCKDCGRHVAQCGPLSHTRLCRPCWERREEENYDALTTRSGPYFHHWRTRIAASVGGVLLDDLHERA